MKLRVVKRSPAGGRVTRFLLAASEGEQLAPFAPGDHIELEFRGQDGARASRCYSLVNLCPVDAAPAHYEIAIQLEAEGKGGSRRLHELLQEGTAIEVQAPRSNFPLDVSAERRILLGGGIGITPILLMARYCEREKLTFDLHVFCRDEASAPFMNEVHALTGGSVAIHAGLAAERVAERISQILTAGEKASVHVCGPSGLIEATRSQARLNRWPEERVRFERFSPGIYEANVPFTAVLLSGRKVQVGARETLLEALRRDGIDVMSSCGSGTCGTCLIVVLEGEIDHRDSVLTIDEKTEGGLMCCCVSRARSEEISIMI